MADFRGPIGTTEVNYPCLRGTAKRDWLEAQNLIQVLLFLLLFLFSHHHSSRLVCHKILISIVTNVSTECHRNVLIRFRGLTATH